MTDVMLGRKRKKTGIENAVIQPADTPKDIEPETIEKPKAFTYAYDDELGTVDFELTDGTPVTLRSPRTRDFLTVSSWLSTADAELQSDQMSILRMAAACMAKLGNGKAALTHVTLDQLLDKLDETNDPEDITRLAIAVNCFRDQLERFFKRDRVRSPEATVSG
jgi:hypothetical protein